MREAPSIWEPSFDPLTEARRRLQIVAEVGWREQLYRACASSPEFFVETLCWYQLPAEHGQDATIYPLVPWGFQRPAIWAATGIGHPDAVTPSGKLWPIIHDKSREVGGSWIYCAAAVWSLLFQRGSAWGLMSRSGTEIDGPTFESLLGKCRFIISMLPRWLLPPEGVIQRTMPLPSLSCPSLSSSIVGSRTVDDAFRSGRKTRILIDEGAAVPHLDRVIKSVQDAGPPIVLGTPQGRGNHFAHIVHGGAGATHEWGDEATGGWLHLRWHYSARPDRNPTTPEGAAWVEAAKSTRTPEAWAQEQEIDYDVSAPDRIWPEFNATLHVLSRDEWNDIAPSLLSAYIVEGWDFGWASLTACVQIAYVEATDTAYILRGRAWQRLHYKALAADYREKLRITPLGCEVNDRYGDIAGNASESTGRSWITNLRAEGLDINGVLLRNLPTLNERIRVALEDGRLLLSPYCRDTYDRSIPSVVEAMSQYRRDPDGRKDVYSHTADAIQYALYRIWMPQMCMIRPQQHGH